MLKPVVVTRPLRQAESFAQRVAALGRHAIVFPLLEIAPLHDPASLRAALASLNSFALAAFVSPNAIDAVMRILPKWPEGTALAVMGNGSRAVLAQYGITSDNFRIISPLDPMKTDSETLLDALDLRALQGKKVLVFRGETGREFLADALRGAGVDVVQVAAYRRIMPAMDDQRRSQLSELANSENDWIITSSEALRNLLAVSGRILGANAVAKILQQQIIVPHVRIKETAASLGFRHIMLTGSGDEQLLAALQFSR